jgi:hypothetical protein
MIRHISAMQPFDRAAPWAELIKRKLVIVGCLALAGCATSPCTVSRARPLPPQRITQLPSPSNPNTAAHITVVRDSGFAGGGATINLRLNGNPVAAFHPCEALRFTLNPGDYVFGIKPVPDLGLGITELGFTAKAGEHYGFRISSGYAGFTLQRSYEVNR